MSEREQQTGPVARKAQDADNMASDIRIRPADASDVEPISGVLGEAAEWIAARGTRMWSAGYVSRDAVAKELGRGEFFIAELGSEIAGTILFQLDDPIIWPDAPVGEAAFVHRLAVRRAFSGGDVSRALMLWAVQRARSLDRRYLRLDCDALRPRLRAVYEQLGFRHHSDLQVGVYHAARYELEL